MAEPSKPRPNPRPRPADRPAAKPNPPVSAHPAPRPTAPATPAAQHQPVAAQARQQAPTQPHARPQSVAAGTVAETTLRDEAEGEGDEEFEQGGGGSFLLFTAMPSWLASMIVHICVILALALYALPNFVKEKPSEITLGDNNNVEETLEDFQDVDIDTSEMEITETSDVIVETDMITEDPLVTDATDLTAAALNIETDPLGSMSVMSSDLGKTLGVSGGEGLDGRGQASRAQLVKEGGGSEGSEAAVAAALKWIAAHQMADGGWTTDHGASPKCMGRCKDPGKKTPCRFGATGLALLPFLGAGQTHKEGEYKYVVERGLLFLIKNMKVKNRNGIPCGRFVDEGNYYSHGLCAIVLCEAYAMTHDKTLAVPAQAALNETIMAQDPVGGGWRYNFQMPGDTSALGWQLMALKSGHMAYLNVPKSTIAGANKFLNAVQSKSGANYGYTDPSENWNNSMTAVGLLCRMYLGWKKEDGALQQGVNHLSEMGPAKDNVYYNYYATQIMHHYGGEVWKKWNGRMRDHLVNTQSDEGHEAGSWIYHRGHANEAGGRLYSTSLSTMILEVYYRHMPLYGEQAADGVPL